MIEQLTLGAVIIAATVLIHGAMLSVAVIAFRRIAPGLVGRYDAPIEPFLTVIAVFWSLLSHMAHVWIWAGALIGAGAFDRLEPSIYFSLVSYTTLGFGDIILGDEHRLLAGLIAVDGFIMFGWTTAFTVNLLQGMEQHRPAEPRFHLPFGRKRR